MASAGRPKGCNWNIPSWGMAGVNLRSELDPTGKSMGHACWVNGTKGSSKGGPEPNLANSIVFGQEDANVAKCLLDLHTRQRSICISVKGSRCDFKHYTARGGHVDSMNYETYWVHAGKHHASAVAVRDAEAGKRVLQDVVDKTLAGDSNQLVLILRSVDKSTSAYTEMHVNFSGGKFRC